MKLKKLKFAYFQSYNQEIEIDFEDLNEKLLLFSGPTGSGKTTIFDAICYALFGSMSSEERNNDEIKSNYATNLDLCYVELTFFINQSEYTIKRIPAQMGPGKQNKPIKIAANAFLDGFNLNKIDEINQKIKELLNMNLEQFRQIVLLPQGKFQKLLVSNSDEKEKIFRSLFNTTNYLNLQIELKNKVNELSSEIKTVVSLISTLIPSEFQSSDYQQLIMNLKEKKQQLEQELFQCKEEKNSLQQKIDLSNQITNTNQILSEKKDSLQKLTSENIDEIKKEVDQFEKYKPLFPFEEQLKNKSEEYNQLEEEKQNLENQFIQLKKIEKETIEYLRNLETENFEYHENKQLIVNLKNQLLKYKNYEILKNEKDSLELRLNQIQLINEDTINHNIGILLEKIEKINYIKNELLVLEDKKKSLNQEKEKLLPLHLIVEYEHNQIQYQSLLLQFNEQSKKLKTQFEKLTQLKNSYYNNIAGILADTLQPSSPCPVCGSIEHPFPALKCDVVDKESVDRQEKYYQTIYNEYTKIELNIKNIEKLLLSYSLEKINHDKLYHKKIESEIQSIEFDILENKKNINQEQLLIQELNLKKEELIKVQNHNQRQIDLQLEYKLKITAILSKLEEFSFKTNKESIIFKIDEIQQKNAKYEQNLNYYSHLLTKTQTNIELFKNNLDKLHDKKNILLQDIAMINDMINKEIKEKQLSRPSINEEKYMNFLNKIIIYQTTLDSLLKEIDDLNKKIESYPQISVSVDELKDCYNLKNEQYTSLHSQYFKYIELINKVEESIIKYNNYNTEYKLYKELLDVASGDVNKNNNISFERFVLGYYLDRVLILANHRFKKMSDNRYHFERKVDYKGKGKKGLELSVFDHYNGCSRSVNTLSGGESFQASLALSLGLSDYLFQKSTVNHIDFLFVDEGFGSLDAESLDIAINTLIEICETGKSIGIISHVEELKNRISTQIQVNKTKSGSTIYIQK